ncbi:hypothetical protein HJC23_007273 [Cyclotella cryptica]|uniref:ADP,ATP carrier protein n=1 Tax=Cyclotella cryptica TaxID=29204 RepID=A0ABD3Q036_9STRA|eukprot:CCRYP_010068-RD/>CCRYP_010068-RD protein AED:0.02 eAED:0.02 QI:3947/1/0.92/1/0.25/0.07/13/1849/484
MNFGGPPFSRYVESLRIRYTMGLHTLQTREESKGKAKIINRTMMKLGSLISCLVLINAPKLVRGFAAPSADRLEFAKLPAPHLSNVRDADENQDNHHTISANDECQEPGRRQFFAAMVAATSMVVLSEIASASTEASILSSRERSPSTSLTVANAAALENGSIGRKETAAKPPVDTRAIFDKAAKKALGGGKAGAAAAVVQVCSLMWLRTSMNYQYRYGGTLTESLKKLYADGGIPRLYQGLPFAIFQGPLTRFGDTAANVGMLALLDTIPETSSLSLPLKTAAGSIAAGAWRIFLMPIDTSKTAMQVEGREGLDRLLEQVAEVGPSPLYQGAVASGMFGLLFIVVLSYAPYLIMILSAAAATAAGHFPWFLTYNFLNDALPVVSKEDDLLLFLVRSAALGLSASCVSDCVSNSLRVIKTTKQTAGLGARNAKEISYQEALTLVLETDGLRGLFGRGLQTRLLTNAIQGAVFSVLWKYFQSSLN